MNTARHIMDKLIGKFQKQGIANKTQLQRKLGNMKLSGIEKLNDFIFKYEKATNKIRQWWRNRQLRSN